MPPTPGPEGGRVLSAYEHQRLANIANNKRKLQALGLDSGLLPRRAKKKQRKKKTQQPRRRRKAPPRGPARRSARVAKQPAVDYVREKVVDEDGGDSDYDQGEESDYDLDEAGSSDDSGADLPQPRKRRGSRRRSAVKREPIKREAAAAATATKSAAAVAAAVADAGKSPIVVEHAKTGRSSCRKEGCREKIPKGELRVGMHAWIMGRNAVTWQHPRCFLSNCCVGVEKTGRGKCKATGGRFAKGEPKLGLRSHTATSWISLGSAPRVLTPVLLALEESAADGNKEGDEEDFGASALEGFDELSDDDVDAVTLAVAAVHSMVTARRAGDVKSEPAAAAAAGKGEDEDAADSAATVKCKGVGKGKGEQRRQPEVGRKTNAKGRVCWKYGSYLCYGKLMPQRETATHCYARTHKGNTKTLTKGKDYWWFG